MDNLALENLSIIPPDLTIGFFFAQMPQNIKKLKTSFLVLIEHQNNSELF